MYKEWCLVIIRTCRLRRSWGLYAESNRHRTSTYLKKKHTLSLANAPLFCFVCKNCDQAIFAHAPRIWPIGDVYPLWRRQVRGELHTDDQHDATGALYVHHSFLSSPSRARLRPGRHGFQHGLRRHARQPADDQRVWRVGGTVSSSKRFNV